MLENKLEILYEDNHLIVVIKEPGILSQKDNTDDLDIMTLIKDYLKVKYNKPGNVFLGLVHRLDRMTGGVMVFAKTSKCASRLSDQIRKHEFEKKYLAVCYDSNISSSGILEDYIEVDEKTGISSVSKVGKYSLLEYNIIDKKDNLFLADITLKTGRHHQIRVQFASRGCPLYGDNLYGKGPKVPLSLYAYSIKFNHPITSEELKFTNYPKNKIWDIFKLQK
jgi:23S rRNA pseudouridine1911/1915/1917 synthase